MTGQDIYDGALRMIAETGEAGTTEDYEERAPYLLGAFLSENALLDRAYRQATELGIQGSFSGAFLELTETFPFCDRFVYAAECYLSSMLILDENPEMADKLYDRYSCSLASIREELPAKQAAMLPDAGMYVLEDIIDRYVV